MAGLHIPGGNVVEDGVAEDVIAGLGGFHMFGGLSQNDRQLHFVIQPLHQVLVALDDTAGGHGLADPLGEVHRRGLFLGEGVSVVFGGL